MGSLPGILLSLLLVLLASGCASSGGGGGTIERRPWGAVDGQPVELFTLRNERGTTVRVTNYGAIVTEVHLRDREGSYRDVVLGFDSLEGYLAEHPYFGCIAGRCANRIAGGRFELGGTTYELARNDGPHHLHGGRKGFDKFVWTARTPRSSEGASLLLSRISPDGEEGYPGGLYVQVRYTLTPDDVLRVEMMARADAPTVVNLAQHSYWNLAGHDGGTIDGHLLRLNAERYLPVDAGLIPVGRFASVAGTPFDFRRRSPIGKHLRDVAVGPRLPRGYDHDFVIDGDPREFRQVAEVLEPISGRRLEVWSNQPGCQLYTGNFLDGSLSGKGGTPYSQHAGFCLETQYHPDSVHHPEWPSPILRPSETYWHRMEFRFGVQK